MADDTPRDWRYWVGTLLMTAAVAFLVSAWISPPDPAQPAAYKIGYYTGGVVFLLGGWWLRSRTDREG
ncbi:MAG: hypothetical protein R3290_13530 [Acidimicrobiia bacterium]|nr:hypothetical protein [Acidimicrobiia bacterium]